MNKVSRQFNSEKSIMVFCNNHVGMRSLAWLLSNKFNVCGVVMHEPQSSYFYKGIRDIINHHQLPYLEYTKGHDEVLGQFIQELKPDVGLSAYFGYILKAEHIHCFANGIVNMHGGFLPWCKGKNPNAWTIMENAPAGVTLHLIDEHIDEGQLLGQKQIANLWSMTAKDLYLAMEEASLELMQQLFPRYLNNELKPGAFSDDEGSYHSGVELSAIKQIELDAPTTARQLLRQLRAATFPPFPGATFVEDGVEYQVEVSIQKVLK